MIASVIHGFSEDKYNVIKLSGVVMVAILVQDLASTMK